MLRNPVDKKDAILRKRNHVQPWWLICVAPFSERRKHNWNGNSPGVDKRQHDNRYDVESKGTESSEVSHGGVDLVRCQYALRWFRNPLVCGWPMAIFHLRRATENNSTLNKHIHMNKRGDGAIVYGWKGFSNNLCRRCLCRRERKIRWSENCAKD